MTEITGDSSLTEVLTKTRVAASRKYELAYV